MKPKRRIGIIISTILLGALSVNSLLAAFFLYSSAALPTLVWPFFIIGVVCKAMALDMVFTGFWFESSERVDQNVLTSFTLNNGVFVMYKNEGYWLGVGRQVIDKVTRTTFYDIKRRPVKSKLNISWKEMPSIKMEE